MSNLDDIQLARFNKQLGTNYRKVVIPNPAQPEYPDIVLTVENEGQPKYLVNAEKFWGAMPVSDSFDGPSGRKLPWYFRLFLWLRHR